MSQDAGAALVQLGQLLTSSGLISNQQLSDVLKKARERQLPIGTTLLILGWITPRELRAAVEAQAFINDKVLPAKVAVQALQSVHNDRIELSEALQRLNCPAQADALRNRLGELLLASGMLTEEKLNDCLMMSLETGMPLGRVLIFKKDLSDKLLLAVLSAQRLIREGLVSREQAIKGLQTVQQRKVSLEESLSESGIYRARTKRNTPLGYMLVEAGLLREATLMMCVELSVTENKPLAAILIDQGLASQHLLDSSAKLQETIENGTFTKELAIEAIRLVQRKDCSVSRAVAQVGLPRLEGHTREILAELLVLSGLIGPKNVDDVERHEYRDFDEMSSSLIGTGEIEQMTFYAVCRALHLIDRHYLTLEDAVMGLQHCRKTKTSLDDALKAMGWTPPVVRRA
jgi:hypothetical protein